LFVLKNHPKYCIPHFPIKVFPLFDLFFALDFNPSEGMKKEGDKGEEWIKIL